MTNLVQLGPILLILPKHLTSYGLGMQTYEPIGTFLYKPPQCEIIEIKDKQAMNLRVRGTDRRSWNKGVWEGLEEREWGK